MIGVIVVLHVEMELGSEQLIRAYPQLPIVKKFRLWKSHVIKEHVQKDNGIGMHGVTVLFHVVVVLGQELPTRVFLNMLSAMKYPFWRKLVITKHAQ